MQTLQLSIMSFTPYFNQYYFQPWPYEKSQGVGIKISGIPNNINDFLDILHQQGCLPVAARRILEDLKEHGFKYTTLVADLNFNYIGDSFKALEVTMSIIPPKPMNKANSRYIDTTTLMVASNPNLSISNLPLNPEDKLLVKSRLIQFKSSIAEHQHHFGAFDNDWNIAKKHIKAKHKNLPKR